VAVVYGQLTRGAAPRLAPTPGYDQYLRWLAARDLEGAASFWRTYLTGVRELPRARFGHGHHAHSFVLAAEATARLVAVAEANRWTLSALVVAAWAMVLGRFERRDDVLVGVTLSARPPELPGVERLVGLCINTLPLRLHLSADADLAALLDAAQRGMLALAEHVADPLSSVQRWSGAGGPLFDSVVVFENYPGDRSGEQLAPGVCLRVARALETTEYREVLTVLPGATLAFEITFSADLSPDFVARRASLLLRVLTQIGAAFERVE
jgi:non-ribosomal peptide synthetase component F